MKICLEACAFLWIFSILPKAYPQLVINIKNQGGDILQETLTANAEEDLQTLEYHMADGTLITHVVHFKHDMQLFRLIVLGEEERGQPQYQVLCFLTVFRRNEFISSDAMSKLRQKNPGTIRKAEEDRGKERFTMDVVLDTSKAPASVFNMCQEAGNSTFTREKDVKLWGDLKNRARKLPSVSAPRCRDTSEQGCMCQLQVPIPWYPCGLKYCSGKDNSGKEVNYRCGIKTCRKTRIFEYYVKQKSLCLWDE